MPQSLSYRLIRVVGGAIAVIMALASWFMSSSASDVAESLGQRNLQQLVESSVTSVRAYNHELEAEASRLSAVFERQFPGQFTVDAGRQAEVAGQQVPVLLSGDKSLVGDYREVDDFAAATGGNATVFVRKGNDFVRVVTSVVTATGDRAVGTLLDRSSPAYQRVIQGQAFNGKVNLFGKSFVTNYTPIKDTSGAVVGIRYVGIDYSDSLASLREGLREQSVGDRGYVLVVGSSGETEGELVVHPSAEGKSFTALGKDAAGYLPTLLSEARGIVTLPLTLQGGEEPWVINYQQVPELGWVVAAALPQAELTASADQLGQRLMVVALITVLLAAVVLVVATRRLIAQPLAQAVSELQAIAEGNYTDTIKVTHAGEVGQLQASLRTMQQQVRETIRQISKAALDLASASEQLTISSDRMAKGSREQSAAATSLASTIEELTTNIDHLAANATEARQLSEASDQSSQRGAEVIVHADKEMQRIADAVRQASAQMESLDKVSEEVASIIGVIEGIAEQTNLLALNAAIEAARAGEQGRGFAVVAGEVRSLAGRTAESAHETTSMIEKMQQGTRTAVVTMTSNMKAVESAAELGHEAGAAIQEIRTAASRVVNVFSEISEHLTEQSYASAEAAQNVERIAAMADTNDSSAQEVAQASVELASMAGNLRDVVARFQV